MKSHLIDYQLLISSCLNNEDGELCCKSIDLFTFLRKLGGEENKKKGGPNFVDVVNL